MSILEIKKYGDPILKKKTEEIKDITPEVKELVFNMTETMQKNHGIGLAAPQIGISKKIIIIATEKGAAGFINPEILNKSKKQEVEEEGCLSLPGLYLKIKRAEEVLVKTKNIEGEELEIKAAGLLARVFQHEIDHLEGILFTDRVSFWQKLKLKQKLKNF